jgi:hypothetical protein
MAFSTVSGPAVNALTEAGSGLRITQTQCAASSSYTTGGDPLTPAAVGLTSIVSAQVLPTNSIAGVTQLVYNTATGKIQAYSAAGTEVTAATNLSALQFQVTAFGV